MGVDQKKPRIAIAMSYHNNLYDTVQALTSRMHVTFLSPRPISHHIYLLNDISITSGIEGFFSLLKHMPRDTNIVLLKHLHRPRNFTPFIVALLRRAKVIIMVQRVPDSPLLIRAVVLTALSFFLRLTRTRVFSVTKEGRDALAPYFSQIEYIPACIDTTRFPVAKHTHTANEHTLRILCIAKYQPRKNLSYLLKAFKGLTQQYTTPSLHLTIVGGVVDPAEFKKTQQHVSQLELDKSVTLQKMVPAADMPNIIAKSNLFILPASHEQLGYAVLEAMAAGLPVLVSSDTGAASYVEHGKNGYLFAPKSVDEIERTISAFIINSTSIDWDKVASFGQQSRTIAQSKHSPKGFIQQFETLLR